MGNGLCVETGSSMTVFDWMDHVLGTVQSPTGKRTIHDDDFIDRLNNYYTMIMLVVSTVFISSVQYVGEPMTCWCPPEFETEEQDVRVRYTNVVCWVSNTYYIPMDKQIPPENLIEQRLQKELVYYQWVPLILLCMALLFKLPRMVWVVMTASAGISIAKVGSLVKETQLYSEDDRDKRLQYVAEYIDQWLETIQTARAGFCVKMRERVSNICCVMCGRHHGNFIISCVLVMKLLYFVNCVGQLYLLNAFLGTKFNVYGFEVLDSLRRGDDWTYSPRFPRVTLCDFQIRQMTNLQRWTVQCVLPINLFNEKIFIFLWFWLVFMAFLSAFSLVVNFYAFIFPQHRKSYVRKYLQLTGFYNQKEKPMIRKFVTYLHQDGCYIFRVFSMNASDVITIQTMKYLYKLFRERELKKEISEEAA
ncbi:hypothetical protein FSP39_012720 [Pinctada imbricata]|uniref:Innexin n=1 Tax=Pinctada imbricata TaxID=66713 RepID=A0AA89BKV1_PINIB|nr:hypothetical protein FSP39_012720 [Pinctada imbricata]